MNDKSPTYMSMVIRITLGVIFTAIITVSVSVVGYLAYQVDDIRERVSETDKTQEVVLQRLVTIEAGLYQVDDSHRWTSKEEAIYQEGIEHRLKTLEAFLPPYSNAQRAYR